MRTKSEWSVRAGIAVVALFATPVAAQVTSLLSVDVHGEQTNKDSLGGVLSADARYVGFFCYDNLMDSGRDELLGRSLVYLRDRVTGVLECISVNSNEVQANEYSYGPALSADVRFAVFSSYANNLVPGDTNGTYPTGHDVFVRDRLNGTTERVSVDSLEAQGNGESFGYSISADGRYVAFQSDASNLVAGDTNASSDVFLRDRQLGLTQRMSVDSSGTEGNGDSGLAQISADGRYVAFYSRASNLVAGDTNGQSDLFLRDTTAGTTTRLSVGPGGAQSNGYADGPSISADGRYVTFASPATTLVPGDTNGQVDVFLRDRVARTTTRISVGPGGAQSNGATSQAVISADGRQVAFVSEASNLAPTDTDAEPDVLIRNLATGVNTQVSFRNDDLIGSFASEPDVSGDGRFVAFITPSPQVPGVPEGNVQVYVRDVVAGTARLVSVANNGAPANLPNSSPAISDAGGRVAFQSAATNLTAGDANGQDDIFVRR